MLTGKTAVVYGAAGPVGSAVARAFAREHASVHLVGRTRQPLDRLAAAIRTTGGWAQVAVVDVLDQRAVDTHAAGVAAAHGSIDVVFNATSNEDVQGSAIGDLPFADFLQPVVKAVTAHHHIATGTARHMDAERGGAIVVMAGGREAIPQLGGAHVAWSALAGLCRQLAADLAPRNIRVAWLLSPGSPDATTDPPGPHVVDTVVPDDPDAAHTLLGLRPTYDDIANAATFFVSSWARSMTATEINLTAGAVID